MNVRVGCLLLVGLFAIAHLPVTSAQTINGDASQLGRDQATYRGGLVAPPLPKPHFVLTDTSAARFDFWNRTQGSVTLLFFGYTSCPDECPMHMARLGAALKNLPPGIAGQVKLVFVDVDPARDNPANLRRWLDNFDRTFVGLTGTPAAVEEAHKAAGVPLARRVDPGGGNYSVTHANFVLAYTKDNLGHVIYPGGISEDDWIHDLPLLVKETWAVRKVDLRQQRK